MASSSLIFCVFLFLLPLLVVSGEAFTYVFSPESASQSSSAANSTSLPSGRAVSGAAMAEPSTPTEREPAPPVAAAETSSESLSTLDFSESGGRIGVNWGRIANDLPSPPKVVELLKRQRITRVKLYDTDATVLTALANSNISVVVAMPNELLPSAAGSQTFTDAWVQANISKYLPATEITSIAVGNEVFVDPNNTTKFLVPAMTNVLASLTKYNLSTVEVSSPIALSCLASSYPTSSGSFKPDLIESTIKPMLELRRKTNSPLMVNAYPFFAYAANSDKIDINYALFKDNAGVVDAGNGLKYSSLFEAQVDAVFAAMKAIQYDDVKIQVTETGWPSNGDSNEIGAGPENAAAYNGNLAQRVLTGKGTPLKPDQPLDVYVFALFSESGSKVQVTGQTWCVANENAGEEKLQAGIDYACGEGGSDCRPIQDGATCHDPDSLVAHASYAFNSYYQKKARVSGSCDFDGAGYVVTQAPRFGTCEFPAGY